MAARNPGPKLNPVPLGFPSFNNRVHRDKLSRIAFAAHEINARVYKNVGASRIRLRCMVGGYGRGVFVFTRLAKMGMQQLAREGWLKKYGYKPYLFR
ncbi:hypothetical protein, conserved [Eimeria tenella]|uniref:Mitochondrial ribosomal protein S14 n=1 Tax=Eimeria tenella TaxID=5802 RepID=U6L2Y1_EIMTE|nr:hypothetical protein, conserved [Eimeria tenella]CDJ43553.1 hypothetical protein, conserved [Eimeria tenella]|eukprot:XP_013234303.1 hypothetical protein, conserved [Eimeria tenella]